MFRCVAAALALITVISIFGCQTAPVTGRRQFMVIPESQESQMGATSFEQILKEEKASTNQQYIDMVNRVGAKIAAAANRPEYKWEFRVIDSPTVNAFALPGGKVAIYEGIIPVCGDDNGLATVISHEVAHVLARHGGERMSQQAAVSGVGWLVGQWTSESTEENRKLIESAYGAASKYGVLLPYSRKHEYEADYIGMVLMARAGYDPAAAARFWERMTAANAGAKKPMEFFSTHPSDANRIAELKSRLQEAYVAAQEQTIR